MADALTTLTKIINSPPGQLAAGGVLAGIVWKFFERVEAVLNEDTKLEIAVWLVERKMLSSSLESWPDTFAKVFDRVFGANHLSLRCFARSCVASMCALLLTFLMLLAFNPLFARALGLYAVDHLSAFAFALLVGNCFADYGSLLETRYILKKLVNTTSSGMVPRLLLIDLLMTSSIAFLASFAAYYSGLGFVAKQDGESRRFFYFSLLFSNQGFKWLWIYPAFFTSIWLWLYAGSGFILKAARRFDIGFDWLNRKFDIERKPLQSIGLVAGALVAIVYWTAVIVRWVVG